jgi:ubiquinone/menaquinone biosynthesis C-methylase UbiE
MKVLDVGSGLTCSSPIMTENSEVTHLDILKSCFNLHIQATVSALPFRNNTFDVVYLSHILEHLENPLSALKEAKRVSKQFVIVRVPNELYTNQILHNECCEEHLYSWTANTLTRLLEHVFPKVHIHTIHSLSKRKESNMFKRKLKTLKTYLIALFYNRKIENEIVAYCEVTKVSS